MKENRNLLKITTFAFGCIIKVFNGPKVVDFKQVSIKSNITFYNNRS